TQVMHHAKRKQWDLFFTLHHLDSIEGQEFSQEFLDAKDKLITDIEKYIGQAKDCTTGRLLYAFLSETGFLARLAKDETAENETILCNLAKFFDTVKDFEYATSEDRVLYFVSYLDMLIDAGDDPAVAEAELDAPFVNIMTIHKAKGLEFSVVFLVSLVETKFPWPKRGDPIELPVELTKDVLPMGDYHLQEERRLFYVAMTRAKNELYLTSAVDYGTKQPRKVSRFVKEAVEEKREPKTIKASAIQAIERNAPPVSAPIPAVGKVGEDKILKLSHYQIDDYLTCPLKYKYVHVLRVPIMTHHTVAYGKALHDAVQYYHQCKMESRAVSEDDVLKAFQNSFQKEGFISKEHIALRLKSAEAALKNFYHEQERLKIVPSFVEKEFSFVLGHNRIVGRWDRVDVVGDIVTVVDFKSSEIRKQQDADKKTKDNLQLSLYSLAYQKASGRLPDFKELHFLDTGIVGRVPVSEKDVERVLEVIEKASVGIRSGNFEAKPNYMACSYCAYRQICPHAEASTA
ncbi:MAG: ATP-dependent DNA helicase, partial [Candidatus Omnitrophica bacterium]|nr:ATP-dependent DNA helicase [Candidatus Omnitrophota bacterium]